MQSFTGGSYAIRCCLIRHICQCSAPFFIFLVYSTTRLNYLYLFCFSPTISLPHNVYAFKVGAVWKDESRSQYNSIHSLKQSIFHSCDRPMHSTVSLHSLLFALVNSHHITDHYAAHDNVSWRCQSDRSTHSKNFWSFTTVSFELCM